MSVEGRGLRVEGWRFKVWRLPAAVLGLWVEGRRLRVEG